MAAVTALTKLPTSDIWPSYAMTGGTAGVMSGAIAGTFIVPVVGSFFGAVIGGLMGLAGGFVLGPVLIIAITRADSVRSALRRSTVASIVGSALVIAVARFSLLPASRLTNLTLLAFLLPVTISAAWAAHSVIRDFADEDTKQEIKNGIHGFVFARWHLCLATVAGMSIIWAGYQTGKLKRRLAVLVTNITVSPPSKPATAASLLTIWGVSASIGMVVGAVDGAVTALGLLVRTHGEVLLWQIGALVGGIAGLTGGLILGPVFALALHNVPSTRTAIRRAMAIGMSGCLLFATPPLDLSVAVSAAGLGRLMWIPIALSGAWGGAFLVHASVPAQLAKEISRGQHGFYLKFWQLMIALLFPVTVIWLLVR